MRLIIQIPCFNEEETLRLTMAAIPRSIDGIDEIRILVLDDGSTDRTAEVAAECGADYIIRHQRNLGLARAFMTALSGCLKRGADLVVNLDADNQYRADDLPKLIEPILKGKAEVTIGTRPIAGMANFSRTKKALQRLGSWVVRRVSGVAVEDAPSGFRAFSRNAALQINVFSSYTYTLETIIQAGLRGLAVKCVPIRVNQDTRQSRLVKSVPSYVIRSIETLFRIFVAYRPLRFFFAVGFVLSAAGFALGVRFLVYFLLGEGEGKVQSLILASVLIGMGFQTCVLGVVADVISVNRKLLEDIQNRVRSQDLESKDS